jgi:hypothetical protein
MKWAPAPVENGVRTYVTMDATAWGRTGAFGNEETWAPRTPVNRGGRELFRVDKKSRYAKTRARYVIDEA